MLNHWQTPRTVPAQSICRRPLRASGSAAATKGQPLGISRQRPGRSLQRGGLDRVWQVVRTQAGLADVRMHDLRHSFASRALALGKTLPVIGKLLGHSEIETTGVKPIWRTTRSARRRSEPPRALLPTFCNNGMRLSA